MADWRIFDPPAGLNRTHDDLARVDPDADFERHRL